MLSSHADSSERSAKVLEKEKNADHKNKPHRFHLKN